MERWKQEGEDIYFQMRCKSSGESMSGTQSISCMSPVCTQPVLLAGSGGHPISPATVRSDAACSWLTAPQVLWLLAELLRALAAGLECLKLDVSCWLVLQTPFGSASSSRHWDHHGQNWIHPIFPQSELWVEPRVGFCDPYGSLATRAEMLCESIVHWAAVGLLRVYHYTDMHCIFGG